MRRGNWKVQDFNLDNAGLFKAREFANNMIKREFAESYAILRVIDNSLD